MTGATSMGAPACGGVSAEMMAAYTAATSGSVATGGIWCVRIAHPNMAIDKTEAVTPRDRLVRELIGITRGKTR